MKFIIIFGPPAVGKMTVGHELAKRTGLKLFHNHMTIDLVLSLFDWGMPQMKLVSEFRRRMFEEFADSDLPGLIFTYVWALDHESDKKYIDGICDIFTSKGADIYFVELYADLSERLKRNESAFRLENKPSKRDIHASREKMLEHEQEYKMNTDNDFFYKDNYVKIDNTNLSPGKIASMIVDEFGFD
jgi:shikimate kinase